MAAFIDLLQCCDTIRYEDIIFFILHDRNAIDLSCFTFMVNLLEVGTFCEGKT